MIKLLRIDDRLVHGQVALTWTPALGADCLVVANDRVAKDDFLKMTMNLAKPASAKLLIKSLTDAVTFITDERAKNLKIFILVDCIQDAAKLADELPELQSINFGGIRAKEGSRPISKAVSVNDADIASIRELLLKGINLEIRQVPTDKILLVEDTL
ncbi:PTS sugar transporter subunit IIB [Dyadobacter luticola]|uniref:PTS sugar transporter subunit IIB n=1 Tax=Dyadobacter luticola TaxID=1979387 RepID=A0A5R9L697_9BACT|nr:PTS sugar transporter subunit IIB [Dyadobacter luticola]TLV03867.1 PTS sugar transporter subunit IIB [Dyadobacter luticola]